MSIGIIGTSVPNAGSNIDGATAKMSGFFSASKMSSSFERYVKPPYFALPVYPAPIGSSAGLRTNANAEVLDATGAAIKGLYACGNDMSSVMGGFYPGPGITLGPALVFGYIAAMHASGRDTSAAQKRAG